MIEQSLWLMRQWGFQYKSHMVWIKPKAGLGYVFWNCHEILLYGTKGQIPAPAPGTQPDSVFYPPVGRHSEKPDIVYEMLERLYPTLPKLEMYARRARPGWDRWGLDGDGE